MKVWFIYCQWLVLNNSLSDHLLCVKILVMFWYRRLLVVSRIVPISCSIKCEVKLRLHSPCLHPPSSAPELSWSWAKCAHGAAEGATFCSCFDSLTSSSAHCQAPEMPRAVCFCVCLCLTLLSSRCQCRLGCLGKFKKRLALLLT